MEIIFLSLDVLNTLRFPRDSSPAPTLFPPLSLFPTFSPLFLSLFCSNPTLSLSLTFQPSVPSSTKSNVCSIYRAQDLCVLMSSRTRPDCQWLIAVRARILLSILSPLPPIPLLSLPLSLSLSSYSFSLALLFSPFFSLLLPLTFLSSFLPTLFSSPISLSLFFANFLPLLHHSFPHFDPPPKPVPTTRERERENRKSRAFQPEKTVAKSGLMVPDHG